MEAVLAAKSAVDAAGHYSRTDLLRLILGRAPTDGPGLVEMTGE